MSKIFAVSGLQVVALCFLVCLDVIPLGRTLLCYSCLRMDCKGDDDACEDIRNFIVSELRRLYYVDPDGTLPPCPEIGDELAWKLMQVGTEPCKYRRAEEATCALSRLQVLTEASEDERWTTHATVMGCAQFNLLKIVQQNKFESYCSLYGRNDTDKETHLKHSYEVETCNTITEYCIDKDFCVAPSQSEVRAFKARKADRSFDLGFIIGIIVVTVVIMAAFILASLCRTPMSWASNTYHDVFKG